jgi:hypothetical protein
VKAFAKRANGACFNPKRMQIGKRAKAMVPVLFADVHHAFWIEYWGWKGKNDEILNGSPEAVLRSRRNCVIPASGKM